MDVRPGFPTVVDEITVRLVAGVVLGVGVLALLTGAWWWYAALAADFALRAVFGPRLSPLAQLVLRGLRPLVSAEPRPTPGAPKRFAASVGALLATGAAVAGLAGSLAGDTGAGWAGSVCFALGALLVVFPALESVAGLCVGCVVFGWLMRAGLVPRRVCLECADLARRQASPSRAG